MPELPEVETVCRQLAPIIKDKSILAVDILDPLLGGPLDLSGVLVSSVLRQGKEIHISLDNGRVLKIHLRMTGRLLWRESSGEMLPHTRARIKFENGCLDLIDPRRFATLSLGDYAGAKACVKDPLREFDVERLLPIARHRKLPVKSFLLDQKVISGIGNIYACEILHEAAIKPEKGTDRLTKKQWQKIAEAARNILSRAVECRGTSVSDWRDLFGHKAMYQNHLKVYGREGETCEECQGVVRRERLGGRGTYFCPRCQR